MSKSIFCQKLKAGAALVILSATGLYVAGMALPALAYEPTGAEPVMAHKAHPVAKAKPRAHAEKPRTAKPHISQSFRQQSRIIAERTVRIYQSGTSDAEPQGPDTRLPPVAMVEAPGVVTCPAARDDAAWKQVPEDIRRTALPGQCFARLMIAPKRETYVDHVLVTPARVEHRTIAAVMGTRTETVIVHPASVREEVVPGRYETHVEHVMVQPERRVWVRTDGVPQEAPVLTPGDHEPAHYRNDGYLTWPGKGQDGGQAVPVDAEGRQYLRDGNPPSIWCLKVLPPEYQDREVRVEIAPPTARRIETPAVTREVTRTVVEQPERVESYTVDAVYKDVEKTRLVGRADTVWREVLCQKNASPKLVMKIQKALADKGYDPGEADGNLGPSTVNAMQKFQADHNLPQGQVSIESVRALGIDPMLQP